MTFEQRLKEVEERNLCGNLDKGGFQVAGTASAKALRWGRRPW